MEVWVGCVRIFQDGQWECAIGDMKDDVSGYRGTRLLPGRPMPRAVRGMYLRRSSRSDSNQESGLAVASSHLGAIRISVLANLLRIHSPYGINAPGIRVR